MIVADGEGTSLPENGAVDLSNFIYSTRGPAGAFYGVDPYLARKLGGDWLMDVPGSDNSFSDAFVPSRLGIRMSRSASWNSCSSASFRLAAWPLVYRI